jgi:hypothetical protein
LIEVRSDRSDHLALDVKDDGKHVVDHQLLSGSNALSNEAGHVHLALISISELANGAAERPVGPARAADNLRTSAARA